MAKRTVLGSVVIVILLAVAPAELSADCMECKYPPSGNIFCGETYYDAGTRCEFDWATCTAVGACEGRLGRRCEAMGPCLPYDQWTCGPSLLDRWELVEVAVISEESPASAGVIERARS